MNITDLKELNPCEDGYKFAASKNSLIEAWNTCERGDWMLWFAKKLDCPLRLLTLAKAKCAETVINLMHDERSSTAVKVAIDFGNGVATREELYAAAAAAAAYVDAAFADDTAADAYNAACAACNAANADATANATANVAVFAADADAYAAHAACANAYADACAASASYSDAYEDAAAADAADADADAAEKENQQQTANICREILTDFIKSKL